MTRYHLVACLLAFGASAATADAAVIRVGRGDDPACQFTSLQAAVDHARALPGPHEIRLSESQYYDVAVRMFNVQADLRGGFLNCSSDLQGGYAVLHGNGTDSVLKVEHAADYTQQFERLLIRGGGNDTVSGGGLYVGGPFLLRLRQVYVEGNRARFGGGIMVGYASRVELLDGTQLRFNTALQGGGLALQNRSSVYLRGADVAISSNQATYSGGGVHVRDHSSLLVGDLSGTGEADQSVRIDGNAAGEYGGGIYLGGSEHDVLLEAYDLAVDNNTARYGGGIAALDGEVRLRRDPAAGGGTQCAPHRPCLRLTGNQSTSDGAALYLYESYATVAQALIAGNRGERSIVMANGDALHMEGVAFHDNRMTQLHPVVLDLRRWDPVPSWSAHLVHLSFVGNRQADSGATVQPLYVSSGVTPTLAASAFDGSVPSEVLALGVCNVAGVAASAFFDAANGDLRPRIAGGLVDRCDAAQVPTTYRDPRLQERCVDAAAPDQGGRCDIGAYELAPPEPTTLSVLALDPAPPLRVNTPAIVRIAIDGAATLPAAAAVGVEADSGETCSGAEFVASGATRLETECRIVLATAGEHVLTVRYAGSDLHAASTAQTTVEVAGPAPTQAQLLALRPTLALVGESFELEASVSGGDTPPTGTLSADAGAAGQCDIDLVDGRGSCHLSPALAGGEHELVLEYAGDATHAPSSLAAGVLVVQGEADLQVGIDNGSQRVGAVAIYEVSLFNAGPDPAYGAELQVDTGAALLDAHWECLDDRGATCPKALRNAIGDVPVGAAMHYRLTLDLAPGDTPVSVSATATPRMAGTDPDLANNVDVDGPDARSDGLFANGFEE